MTEFWSAILHDLQPYVPGEQPKVNIVAKLNTNENPYPPSSKALAAIRQAANDDLRRYPDPNCDDLRETVASYYGIKPGQVFVGNGSDEILAFCFPAFFNKDKKILYPDITYSFYPVYSRFFGIPYREIPVRADFSIPMDDFLVENNGVIISNPNAPTARCLEVEELLPIVKYNLGLKKIVLVDEAYIDFGGTSMVPFIKDFPNLLVIQTLSKSRSFAGLRIGLAFGSVGLIEGLNRVKSSFNSYTLDRLALIGAAEAFKDGNYFRATCKRIIDTRERVVPEMENLGFTIVPSKANFIFASHNTVPASKLFEALRSKGIFVRYFKKPRIDNYLRITIGTDKEMDELLKAIREILG